MFGGRGLSMPPAAYHLRKLSFDVPTTFSRNIVIVKRDVFMMHLLKRHPIPIVAWFEDSLVLTYALPRERLRPLLPPGLELDGLGDFGFLAVALVQTRGLRPAGFPAICGQDFSLVVIEFLHASRRGRGGACAGCGSCAAIRITDGWHARAID